MKVGREILWNVTLICETSQICCLMGRRPMEDVLGNHLKDLLFHLVHWLSITLSQRRISHASINLERKFYLDCSSDTLCTRGEFGRVTYWLQTLRSWRRWTHRKSTRKDSMRRRRYFPKKKENLFFQSQMDESKPFGGDQDLRTSTLVRHRPTQGMSNIDFLGESEGSLPQFQDSLPDAGEAMNDFWSMSGNFIYRHHVEPRVKLYSPREESFPIPLKYIDVSRTTHTILDVKQESRIDDYWNMDGSRDLSDPWTGFTQFTTPTSSSSSQDSVFDISRYTENPVPKRSGSTREELRGNLQHKPTETDTKIKMKDTKKYKAICCMTCRTGFRISENLVDESCPTKPRRNPAPQDRDTASSSHELPVGSPTDSRAENFLKGTCTKLPCDHWHPPECQFYKSETGCKFGAECSFPHWKDEEHRRNVVTKVQ